MKKFLFLIVALCALVVNATSWREIATVWNKHTSAFLFDDMSDIVTAAVKVSTIKLNVVATAAPTAATPQVYAGSATIANLTATGTAIQWYAAATGGTALATTTALVDGTIYYVSQTVAGAESTRVAVTVRRISAATQTLSAPATVANLISTPSAGTTAAWFTAATGGTALIGTTAINSGTYYVEQSATVGTTTVATGFNNVFGIAVEAGGTILATDFNGGTLKRVNADGTGLITLASGFTRPCGIAVQTDGKILVADQFNNFIKRINADGTGILILGSGFNSPHGVAVQADGKILVADRANNAIKRMNADGSGIVTLGSGFSAPSGVSVQADGKILIADYSNNVIKRMNADGTGIVTLITGLSSPYSVAEQADGKILIADSGNNLIKRTNADGSGMVTLGSGFSFPTGVTVQANGAILVADFVNNAIKRISVASLSNRVAVTVNVNTIAPTAATPQVYAGSGTIANLTATGTAIQWYAAATGGTALATTTALVDGTIYYVSQTVAGVESSREAVAVRQISAAAQTLSAPATVANLVSTPSAGTTAAWFTAATGGAALASTTAINTGTYFVEQFATAGTTTVASGLNGPYGVAIEAGGTILVTGFSDNTLKRMNADGTGVINLGSGFGNLAGIAVQADGKIIVVDHGNSALKRLNADGTGIITLASGLNLPYGVAVQTDGKILVSEFNNTVIKRFNADGTGLVTLGTGFISILGVSVQADGKILVADYGGNAIKRMNADGTGIVTLTAGLLNPYSATEQSDGRILIADSGNNLIKRMNADGSGIATVASGFNLPIGLAVQANGSILVADYSNGAIKRISVASTSNRVAVTVNVVATPTAATPQVYAGSATIANLTATGTAIQWYAAATGGTALATNTVLVDGTIYYVSQTVAGAESTRVAVTVRRISAATQTFCAPATVASLVSTPSTGSTAGWFTALTGGAALASTTAISTGNYFVEQITTAGTTIVASGFNNVFGVAVEAGGTILATDYSGGTLKRVNVDGTGLITVASGFSTPCGIAVQTDGKILVADQGNSVIKRINADGTGILILGSGFNSPHGVAVQADGTILVADRSNNAIKRMNADGSGIVTLGSGFSFPSGVSVQADGKILVADQGNNVIKRMNADGTGIVTLITGLSSPYSVAEQADGKILIADSANNVIKRTNADGSNIVTLGSGFSFPTGVAVQANGAILVADFINNAIKRITTATASNRVSVSITVNEAAAPTATTPQVYAGTATIANLTATGAAIQWYATATGGAVLANTTALVDGSTYFVSQIVSGCESTRFGVVVRRISAAAQTICAPATVANLVSTPSAGTTAAWFTVANAGTALVGTTAVSTGTYYVEQGAPSTVSIVGAGFFSPAALTVQPDGKILVADFGTNSIKRMNGDGTGLITLGSGFSAPTGIITQADGKILVADRNNNFVKRMNADGTGIVTLGSGFNAPTGLALEADGKILVTDNSNAIKRMNADGTGIVTVNSSFNGPFGVAVQADGKILVADTFNNAIKRMNADGTGIVTLGSGFFRPYSIIVQSDGKIVVADTSNNAVKRMNADGTGIVTLASGFNNPTGVALQADGAILVSDFSNNAIKRISTANISNRVAVTVTVNTVPTPTITAGGPITFCAGGSVTLTSSAATGNSWSNGAFTQSITVNTSGNYTVAVTSNGCTSTTSTATTVNVISTPSTPTITANGPTTFCTGGNVTLTSSSATGNLWSTGATTPSITVSSSGNYTTTVTINGCPSATSAPVSVFVSTVTVSPTLPTQNYIVGTPISPINLSASAGTPATFTYTVSAGLPVGVNLVNGVISGIPTSAVAAGSFTVTATSSVAGCTGSRTYNYTVSCPTLVFVTTTLPNRNYNQVYSQTVVVSGGTTALIYTISSGALPLGFTLSPSGTISGTSIAVNTATFTILATDANGCSVSRVFTIGLNQIPITVTANAITKVFGTADPVLTYTVVPSLQTGDSFTGSLTRIAGENVGTYAINQGSLSAGNNYIITYVGASFTITQAPQTITWVQNLVIGCDGLPTYQLVATASSGLPVTFVSQNNAIATVTGTLLTIVGQGTTTITASQAGNSNYFAASNVVRSLVVSQSGLIRKHWRDVLFFDNSSNMYSNYQWYKNGVLIAGANQQYFKENGDLLGTYYATALKNGISITSCSLSITAATPEFDIKVFPNPVTTGDVFEVETTLPTASLQNAQIQIFSYTGALISQFAVTGNKTTLTAPNTQGVYVIKLSLSNGNVFTVNLLVK